MSPEASGWWLGFVLTIGVLVAIQNVRPREFITRLAEWWIKRQKGAAEPECGYLPVSVGTLNERHEYVVEERVPSVDAPVVLRKSVLTNQRKVEMTAREQCIFTHVAWLDEAGEWAAMPCAVTTMMAGDTVAFEPGMIKLLLIRDWRPPAMRNAAA